METPTMIAMRQRLLLVAGWLAAVVGAGLVAAGAVAVAGGQVLDRPLRPLTAAEVAALPVVSVGSTDAIDPPASGGVEKTTGEPTEGSDQAGADTMGPARGGRSVEDQSEESARWDRFTNPRPSETRVISLDAGTASFQSIDGALHLLWTTPGAGYVSQTLVTSDTMVSVSFSSNRGGWIVEARLVNGALEIVTTPTPLA